MAKKQQKREYKRSSTNGIVSITIESIALITILGLALFYKPEEQVGLYYGLLGLGFLLMIGLIYCSVCAIVKTRLKEDKRFDDEYERLLSLENKPEPKKKITSAEFMRRCQEEELARNGGVQPKKKGRY